ncbi:MAG: 3'-5' exonuclease [Thiobacillus sp.]|uniref:3'-5' exonuclease n=1 Tax=Thiobacillus sp. TaxID=924 RepID=UPI0027365F8D|nr:3'-5' exonuclease [Thiobacillus sp.]MDP3585068.1 3'-5' exonuclease [Thiobacillus sp.]
MIWPFAKPLPPLDAESSARRDALIRDKTDLKQPLATLRWCVVDTETGGLDAERDPLLSIGAVAIEHGRIALETSLEVGLTQAHSTAESNILIHGISDSEQRAGDPPHRALLDWLEFAGAAPRVAFHAAFDQAVLQRAEREHLGVSTAAPWFDAAVVAPLLFPDAAPHCRQLDDWLAHFGIAVFARHGALADAYATAELWLVLLDTAQRNHITTAHQLRGLLRARRWLSAN